MSSVRKEENSRTSPLESRVYRDKKSPLHWVSAPTVPVVVFGSAPAGGAPGPLEIFRFALVGSSEEPGNVFRPEGRKSGSQEKPRDQYLRPCTGSSLDVRVLDSSRFVEQEILLTRRALSKQ